MVLEKKNIGNLRAVFRVSCYITLGITLVNILTGYGSGFSWLAQLEHAGISFVYAFAITATNVYYNIFITKKYSWETATQKRLWAGAIGSIVLTIITFALVRLFVGLFIYGKSWNRFLEGEAVESYLFALIIAVLVSAILHAFYFYKALQDTKVKEQKIIAGTASARFDALKNQLDPHFLFNSLNVLTSLIEEDPHQAQKFTTSLSKVYRYVLEQKNKDLVSVADELAFAKTYIKLLKMRFEDSIVLDIPEVVHNPEAKIVPLSLQLLLENTVKHNVVMASRPLHIEIFEEDGCLVVRNTIQKKQVVSKGSGVGLQNIKERYAILTDRYVSIDEEEGDFVVRLPMLTQQVSVSHKNTERYIEDKRYKKAKER